MAAPYGLGRCSDASSAPTLVRSETSAKWVPETPRTRRNVTSSTPAA